MNWAASPALLRSMYAPVAHSGPFWPRLRGRGAVQCARRWRRVLDRSARRAAPAQWSQNAAAKFRPSADRAGVARGLRRVAGLTFGSLADATRLLQTAAAERAMSRLIGLGEDRTPAGDDYLVGYFAALWACSDASKAFAAALTSRLTVLATRTEDLSRTIWKQRP